MKLTIVLEKKSRFDIDLPEGDAKKLYKNIMSSVVNSMQIQSHTVRTQPVLKDIEPKEIITEEEKETVVKAPEEKVENVPDEEPIKSVEQNPRTLTKKLVMLKCSGCSDTLVGVVNEGQWSFTCKSCRTNNTIENLKPATYICPNCGYKANFNVKDGLDVVKCKNCDGDIDLIYHEKKDKYLSANLV